MYGEIEKIFIIEIRPEENHGCDCQLVLNLDRELHTQDTVDPL